MKISKLLEFAEEYLTFTVYRKPPRGDCNADTRTGEEDNGRKL